MTKTDETPRLRAEIEKLSDLILVMRQQRDDALNAIVVIQSDLNFAKKELERLKNGKEK